VRSVPDARLLVASEAQMTLRHRYAGKNRDMSLWKPHALAKPHSGQLDLRIGDHVEAGDGVANVAGGTPGRVILANGFNWQRYRVVFANGVEVGDLDHRHIVPAGPTAKRLAKRAKRA
jgi:hypothetical protein